MGSNGKSDFEPRFSRQEQGVVYLFSRYWDRIDEFKDKKIFEIHTHFPDCRLENEKGKLEAIEFEYGLKSFSSHIPKGHRDREDGVGSLCEDGFKTLYIVYWDEDDDKNDLKVRISKYFKGKIEFVCLKKYFLPHIEKGLNSLISSWKFSPDKKKLKEEEAYSFSEIEKRTKTMIDKGFFKKYDPDKNLYRAMCFEKENADFVELGHWENIHFFTTDAHNFKQVPRRLFFWNKGSKNFVGYLDVKISFEIKKRGKEVSDYFRDFYFYSFEDHYKKSMCLVYSRFNKISENQGRELYSYLKKDDKYHLGQTSIIINDAKVMEKINKILGI